MAVVVTTFQLLSRKKVVYFGGLAIFLAIFFSVFFEKLQKTFQMVPPLTELSEDYELIINLNGEFTNQSMATLNRRFEMSCKILEIKSGANAAFSSLIVCDLPEKRNDQLDQIRWWLDKHPSVNWWEWNNNIQIDPLPSQSDPNWTMEPSNPDVNDPMASQMWHFNALNFNAVHQLLAQNQEAVQKRSLIAILDTGVDHLHEDIASNYLSIHGESDGDPMGHGSHCAGIAGGVTNNGIGISSLSPNNLHYQLTSYRVLNERGFGNKKGIIKGIINSVKAGADVISLSLGGPSYLGPDKAYEMAVNFALENGVTVVVAAGNAGRPARNFSPANVPGVICVGAVDENWNLARFSNTPEGIEYYIAAPGVRMLSTLPNNQYEFFNGTSMATPLVASAVAILKSIDSDLSTPEIYALLSAETPGSSSSGSQFNRLDVEKSVRELLDK